MLKRRIDKLERNLEVSRIDKKNVEAIHKFFLTGNVNLIPQMSQLRL